MFLKALADYLVHGQGLGTSNPAVLIEAFVTHEDSDNEPLSKRRRTTDEERRIPDVTHGEESGDFTKFFIDTIFNAELNFTIFFADQNGPLVQGFLNAVRYYELLASDPDLIGRLEKHVRPPSNLIFPFITDTSIYHGRFKEALSYLRQLPPPNTPVAQCQFILKSASLFYATNDLQSMTDQTWQALTLLTTLKPSEEAKVFGKFF